MKRFLHGALAACISSVALAQEPALQVDWIQSPINGHWYGVDYTPRTWTESEALAVSLGGHLATIRSQAEQDWIEQTVSPYWPPISALHIGLNDAASEGTFAWSSGEPVNYTNWGPGEPNDLGGEDYVSISGPGGIYFGLWNDASSSFVTRPLIELPTEPTTGWSWPQVVPTGARPVYGCLADLDGDGDLDYASPDAEECCPGGDPDSISIHWNDGAGNFSPGPVIQVPAEPRQVVSMDVDQDGNPDLVYGCEQGATLGWIASDGAGGLSGAQTIEPGVAYHSLTVTDIDADGTDDLIAVDYSTPANVFAYRGMPSGGFAPRHLIENSDGIRAGHPTDGDLNGDGAVDLVVNYDGEDRVSVFLNDGIGQFPQRLDLATGSRPWRCSLADLDLDGDLDLLVPALASDRLEVWHNDGAGGFQKVADYPAGNGPHDSTTADVNGDGVSDVIVPSYLSDDVRILYGDGVGGLTLGEVFTGHDYARSCATGDLDGNGSPDLLVVRHNANSFAVWKNHRVFDCNQNGLPDADDIANGTSLDCNANGIPDECDIANGTEQDCDGNGLLDSCEIAAGTAEDCDADGTLDSCEIAADSSLDLDQNGVLDSCQCEISTYCFSTMNSTGGPAHIGWAGSGSLSSQDLSLIATELPPHQFGIFFYGAQEHFAILGDGVLCAKPPLYRIGGAQPSGPDGTVTLPLDYGSHPMSGGPGQVTSSSTWYFQFWFRDPTYGPAGSNTTDGLEVTFCP